MKKIASIMIVSMLLFSMILIAPLVYATGTTLSETVTATAHWTRTFAWTIDKSVTPDTWNLFTCDSGTSQYTITATKGSGTDAYWIDGVIAVTNGGSEDTENLKIIVELRDGVEPPNDWIANFTVDLDSNTVIPKGETRSYPYSVTIPSSDIHLGGTYKIYADTTITNHAGHQGYPYGPSEKATTRLPNIPTLINDEIDVSDTNGGSWHFTGSGSVSYEKTFTSAGTYTNTATIEQTGQSASATVTVNLYNLCVSKDAQTYFTRTYMWTIVKTGDQTYLELKIGDTADVHYTITVDATFTDSDWMVKQIDGIIVHNPAPIPATINSITDLVSPDIPADVYLPVDLPYELAAGKDLIALYKAKLPDATSRTNTAAATLQNYAYKYDGSKTATGTTDFSGSAAVDFSNAIITEIDKSIHIIDTYADGLGTVTYGVDTLPAQAKYTRTIGPYGAAGDYTVDNTASFVTSDTGTTGESSWTVDVHVPLPPTATISGLKFYDSDADGIYDPATENGLPLWPIQLWQLQADGTWLEVQDVQTGPLGAYKFESLYPGTYRVTEVLPTPPPIWIATTPMSSDPIPVTDGEAIAGPVFGNVQLTCGHGGLTLGFWSNKNGQAMITYGDRAMLNLLNLYVYKGTPPFISNTQIKNYLLSATATDMRWMLSAQLIATELDCQHGLSAGTIVYVGPSSYVPSGFITIGNIMNNANAALLGTDRAAQEYWKNLLDGINNNRLPFVV